MVISPKFLNMMTQLNISLSEKQLEQFDKYYQLLVEWNKVMNLTGITEYDEVFCKDFADSLSITKANDMKEAALAEAQGIEAKGRAEADAIKAKAEAMKLYGEAATLQLILDSGVLPDIVNAYSKPIAEAMAQIDSITMYGEGNTAKLTEEISKNGNQIFEGLEKATGLDIKSLLAGYLGGKLINKDNDK